MRKYNFSDSILFENDNYIVINKPSGLSVLEDRSSEDARSVLDFARAYFPNASACHRIDKETSGILVLSKNEEAYRHLSLQFQNREVAKMYHALVHGKHNFKEHPIELGIEHKNGKSIIDPKGKFSATLIETVAILSDYTLMECMPLTGRTHQIRVHLSFFQAPIVGDLKYGGKPFYLSEIKKKFQASKHKEEKPILNRTALHAFKIKFNDLDGSEILLEAPYPKDLQVALKQLHKYK